MDGAATLRNHCSVEMVTHLELQQRSAQCHSAMPAWSRRRCAHQRRAGSGVVELGREVSVVATVSAHPRVQPAVCDVDDGIDRHIGQCEQ